MPKKWLIGIVSILGVVLIVLSSQSSVVGFRVVKDSQQSLIKESVSKIKANLLTLKSLISQSKPLLGGIYNFIMLIHFIVFYVLSVLCLITIQARDGPPYLMGYYVFMIILFFMLIGDCFVSVVPALFLAALWPLIDALIIGFFIFMGNWPFFNREHIYSEKIGRARSI
jgi:hypothetical protein